MELRDWLQSDRVRRALTARPASRPSPPGPTARSTRRPRRSEGAISAARLAPRSRGRATETGVLPSGSPARRHSHGVRPCGRGHGGPWGRPGRWPPPRGSRPASRVPFPQRMPEQPFLELAGRQDQRIRPRRPPTGAPAPSPDEPIESSPAFFGVGGLARAEALRFVLTAVPFLVRDVPSGCREHPPAGRHQAGTVNETSSAPAQTGQEMPMEEAIRRRNSEPLRPRVMRRSARKDSGEALTGARAGWAMEPRNCVHFRAPTLFAFDGRQHRVPSRYQRGTERGPARSKTPRTHGSITHGDREVRPSARKGGWRADRKGKTQGR